MMRSESPLFQYTLLRLLKETAGVPLLAQEFSSDLVWPVAADCGNEHNELASEKSHALSL